MLESRWSEFANTAAPLLEGDETIKRVTTGIEGSRWLALLGPLGWWSSAKILAVTDLHVLLFNARAFKVPTATALAEKNDISDITAEYQGSFPFNRLIYRSSRRQVGRTLWISVVDSNEAQAVVEAIESGGR